MFVSSCVLFVAKVLFSRIFPRGDAKISLGWGLAGGHGLDFWGTIIDTSISGCYLSLRTTNHLNLLLIYTIRIGTVSVLVRSKPYPCLQENAQRQFIVHSKLTYERELDIVSMCRLRNACKHSTVHIDTAC